MANFLFRHEIICVEVMGLYYVVDSEWKHPGQTLPVSAW